jgi:hypothetical protein
MPLTSNSGSADTSWMDDLAIERLEMVAEQIGEDLARLEDGEHVSGPSAAEYRARIGQVSRFAGRTITHVRNVQRLLGSADPGIHQGEAMTCVWRAETAACHRAKIEQGLPADDTPDESECRTSCTNLVYIMRATSACLAWSTSTGTGLDLRFAAGRVARLASVRAPDLLFHSGLGGLGPRAAPADPPRHAGAGR